MPFECDILGYGSTEASRSSRLEEPSSFHEENKSRLKYT